MKESPRVVKLACIESLLQEVSKLLQWRISIIHEDCNIEKIICKMFSRVVVEYAQLGRFAYKPESCSLSDQWIGLGSITYIEK